MKIQLWILFTAYHAFKKDILHFWQFPSILLQTDGVHEQDDKHPSSTYPETYSEAVKVLKGEYVIKAIEKMNGHVCLHKRNQ